MFDWLEILFLFGLALLGLAVFWGGALAVRRRFRRTGLPLAIGLVGMAMIAAPAIYTQVFFQIDLGPRLSIVDGEKHLTLTGWDGNTYEVLAAHADAVVVQMANPDVDDGTVRYLANSGMPSHMMGNYLSRLVR